ncbi:MAG: hypothetical protein HYY40_10845 [Bacteroidetes bacterium]|nr:hypothetical protein [Bacteroidota bacterium]
MRTLKNIRMIGLACIAGSFILTINSGCSRKGCTDPNAINYDVDAKKDDGSCIYAIEDAVGTSTTDLLSLKVTTGPTIDGTIDNGWKYCQKLTTTVSVPDPGNDASGNSYFNGYVGNIYNVTVRSMYDASKIYFLAEWNDAARSENRQTWYFDTATKRWKQESNKPTFDGSGNKTRDAFYEDKFSMLWNVNNSVASFNSQGCYASCHQGQDVNTHYGAPALHYTNSTSERIDMWHWKLVRNDYTGQFDDQYQDNDEFGNDGGTPPKPEGGRKSDPKTSGGYSNNKQTLTITGTTTSVSVPKYFIPNRTNYYVILQSEIDAGTALVITAVDSNGVLTYSGGTIDPNSDVEYQRNGATTGTKCMPSIYASAMVGDRGDITAKGVHTGTGWVLEYSRALTPTDNTGSYDVVFSTSSSSEYVFGIGVFDNAAIAHAIAPKFTLKFKQ